MTALVGALCLLVGVGIGYVWGHRAAARFATGQIREMTRAAQRVRDQARDIAEQSRGVL